MATVSSNSGKNYAADFNTSGKEAKVFVKAVTKEGGFYTSELFVFNVADCKPSDNTTTTEPDNNTSPPKPNNPKDGVTETNNPPVPKPDPKPQPEENDPSKIVIVPNPAVNVITLKNATYGKFYRIYTIEGRAVQYGLYLNSISVSGLHAGTYVIYTNGKAGQFVKL